MVDKIKGVLLKHRRPLPPEGSLQDTAAVLDTAHYSGPGGTVPELLFEKKGLIRALQQLLVSHLEDTFTN